MMHIRSADQSLMREMNIALILECLRRESLLSRAKLAAITGLTKATVSSLVHELLDARYIRETGTSTGATGRPSIGLELNPEAGYLLGAEIGVDFLSVLLTDFSARSLWRDKQSNSDLGDEIQILNRTVLMLNAALSSLPSLTPKILGLGLGVPGLVDVGTGRVLFAPNLGWRNVPVQQILGEHFSFPIYVDNDAHVAAMGESYFGAGRGAEFLLYIGMAVGVGGGLVLHGRVLPGASGFLGEVGHMTIDPYGPPCNCGSNGCWEQFISQWAVYRRVSQAVAAGRKSSLLEAAHGDLVNLTIPLIVSAADQGDPVAVAALRETGYYIGLGLANLINALNPQRVVLGGILTQAHHYLMPEIQSTIRARALPWIREACEVFVAEHGSDATVIGGIAAVYQRVLSQPLGAARISTAPTL